MNTPVHRGNEVACRVGHMEPEKNMNFRLFIERDPILCEMTITRSIAFKNPSLLKFFIT